MGVPQVLGKEGRQAGKECVGREGAGKSRGEGEHRGEKEGYQPLLNKLKHTEHPKCLFEQTSMHVGAATNRKWLGARRRQGLGRNLNGEHAKANKRNDLTG